MYFILNLVLLSLVSKSCALDDFIRRLQPYEVDAECPYGGVAEEPCRLDVDLDLFPYKILRPLMLLTGIDSLNMIPLIVLTLACLKLAHHSAV